jgi:hypothetical protein
VRNHLTFIPGYLLPDPSKLAEINASAVREKRVVYTSREKHREYNAKKRHNKKTNGKASAAPYESKIDDNQPFDDRANEMGAKRSRIFDDGNRDGSRRGRQFHRFKRGGFI